MSKLWAFIMRDLRIQGTNRFAPILVLGQILLTLLPFFFLGRLIDPSRANSMEPYGGAYFPFVLFGLACGRFVSLGVGFSGMMRQEQGQGTLEALLATPTSALAIFLDSMAWYVLWAAIELGLYLICGVVFFGLDLSRANLPAGLFVMGVTVASLSSIGVLSACTGLLFQEADPFSWGVGALNGAARFLSGVYFPIALLPAWLQSASAWSPLTYALEGLRRTLLHGASFAEVAPLCAALAGFGIVMWALACLGVPWTIARLKQRGALSFH